MVKLVSIIANYRANWDGNLLKLKSLQGRMHRKIGTATLELLLVSFEADKDLYCSY